MSEKDIQIVLSKIDNLKEIVELRFSETDKSHKRVDEHLKKLNGQTQKNTNFRIRWSGVYLFIGLLGTTIGLTATLINLF